MHRRIYTCFPEGKTKAFTCSYDDGKVMDRDLVALMNRYGIKATFHLNSDYFGISKGHRNPYISECEVATLYQGHEVACHTCSHITMTRVDDLQNIEEVVENRKALESLCGYPVTGFSYPNGCYNEHVSQLLKACGIGYARTTKNTARFDLPQDFLQWHPTCHHREDIVELLEQFLSISQKERLSIFYVWGHSYEFSTEKDWQRMEQFFQRAHGHSDIWYATNQMIQRYMDASNRLVYFADHQQVYNPSAIDLWISVNECVIKLEAGGTTTLVNR